MRYQAIAFDLDGTLLSSQATILASSKQAIQAAREKGIKVFIVTGRHHTAVRPYYVELGLDTPVVCCNGTYLYDFQNEAMIEANPLPTSLAQQLIAQAKAAQIHVAVYTDTAMTYEQLNPHFEKFQKWVATCPEAVRPNVQQVADFSVFAYDGTTTLKVLVSDPDVVKLQQFVDRLPSVVSAEWSWEDRVDITHQGNSKGESLARLFAREGIDLAATIAFGDNFNDISMLSRVGLGIAMGGCDEAVQRAAKRVIGSHNQDSIAETLTELLTE